MKIFRFIIIASLVAAFSFGVFNASGCSAGRDFTVRTNTEVTPESSEEVPNG